MIRKLSCYNLPWPVDWSKLFDRESPLIVEIGFGNGDHLIYLAQKNPDANVIGVEIANKSMQKAEKKIANLGLKNVRVVHSRGETLLYHLLETGTIHEFHINYPDPWFKSKHKGRRIIQRNTVNIITDRLRQGGLLYLATDIIAYAQMSHELLSTTLGLHNTLNAPWINVLPERFVTKYEAKGLREGRIGNYLVYERNGAFVTPIPTVKELHMPHITLFTPMTLIEITRKFERLTGHIGEIYISALNAFVNQQHPSILFEVSVQEPTIDQHITIILSPRKQKDEYILQLGAIGTPRATAGLHQAITIIADWIVSLHPEAQINARKVMNKIQVDL